MCQKLNRTFYTNNINYTTYARINVKIDIFTNNDIILVCIDTEYAVIILDVL